MLQTLTHSKQPATVFGSRKSHSRSVDADRVLIRVRLCGVNLTPRRQLKHIEMTVKSNWFLTDPEANSRSLELKSISGSEWCQAARRALRQTYDVKTGNRLNDIRNYPRPSWGACVCSNDRDLFALQAADSFGRQSSHRDRPVDAYSREWDTHADFSFTL